MLLGLALTAASVFGTKKTAENVKKEIDKTNKTESGQSYLNANPFNQDGNLSVRNTKGFLFSAYGDYAGEDGKYDVTELEELSQIIEERYEKLEGKEGRFAEKLAKNLGKQMEMLEALINNFSEISSADDDSATLSKKDIKKTGRQHSNGSGSQRYIDLSRLGG